MVKHLIKGENKGKREMQMGFLDKLKDVAQSVADVADKAMEQKKERERENERLKNIGSHGSIKGDNLPKPKKFLLNFYIDAQTRSLIVYEDIIGATETKRELVREYPLSDIVAFRHDKETKMENELIAVTSFYNTLVLSSGETLELYTSYSVRKPYNKYSFKNEVDGWINISVIILTFISIAADDKTKQWINQFYIDCGGKAPFSENGVMGTDEYYDMHQEVFDKKKQEWEEKRQQIQQ